MTSVFHCHTKNICVFKMDCIEMIAQSIAQVNLSKFSHRLEDKLVASLNVRQVIFMLHLFLNIRCW